MTTEERAEVAALKSAADAALNEVLREVSDLRLNNNLYLALRRMIEQAVLARDAYAYYCGLLQGQHEGGTP